MEASAAASSAARIGRTRMRTRGAKITPAGPLTRPPERNDTKASLTARIVSTAARWLYQGRRVDMQGLAEELGVSRVTLFRRVGSREELISQALWRLTERMLKIAVERWEAERPDGELHTPGTIRHINAMVAGSAGLRRLLDDEPALALRVITDPRGPIQSGIVAFNEVLLRRDMAEFGLVPVIEPSALAYALARLLDDEPVLTMRVLTDPRGRIQSGFVAFNEELLRRDMAEFGLVTIIEPGALAYALLRLGESFLYADVIAARKPDVETANRLQQALIEGILP